MSLEFGISAAQTKFPLGDPIFVISPIPFLTSRSPLTSNFVQLDLAIETQWAAQMGLQNPPMPLALRPLAMAPLLPDFTVRKRLQS